MSTNRSSKFLIVLLVATFLVGLAGIGRSATADEKMPARLRVAHLAPFAMDPDTEVTVVLNGDAVQTEVGFGDSFGYVSLEPGEYKVEIFLGFIEPPDPVFAGGFSVSEDPEPVLTATYDLEAGKDYSVIAYGDGVNQELGLLALEDDNSAPEAGKFHLRLGHLAPFAAGDATADIRLQDGTPVVENVNFKDVTDFVPLDAGVYDLKITTPGGETTLIDPAPFEFAEGMIVTAFAAGEGSNQDLGVFAWPSDMDGFFLPLQEYAWLRVAHLAPFATGSGTSVSVALNGNTALTDFVYGDSTKYIQLPVGEYLVEVIPTVSSDAAISATVDLMADTYYSAVAYGDGANQPLGLLALVDDNSMPASGNFHLRLGHLAPFASGPATADIRLEDGTVVVDNVDFTDVTDFLSLPAGTYDLKITTPDGTTTLINPLPVAFNDGDIVTAFATGEGKNQDLGVFAWPVDVEGFFLPLGESESVFTLFLPVIQPGQQ